MQQGPWTERGDDGKDGGNGEDEGNVMMGGIRIEIEGFNMKMRMTGVR